MRKKKKAIKKKVTAPRKGPMELSPTPPAYHGNYFADLATETAERLRRQDIKPIEANAIAKQGSFILQRAKIQLDIMKFTGGGNKVAARKLLE